MVEAFKQFQNAPSIHVCGFTKDRWQDIVDTGISSFSVDNCEDMKELKLQFGNEIGIVGNVSPVDVLRNGTCEEVVYEIKKCILQAGDSPKGFTLSPGCTVPINTPRENIIAMMNAASIYGKDARKGCIPNGIVENRELSLWN